MWGVTPTCDVSIKLKADASILFLGPWLLLGVNIKIQLCRHNPAPLQLDINGNITFVIRPAERSFSPALLDILAPLLLKGILELLPKILRLLALFPRAPSTSLREEQFWWAMSRG